MFEHASLRPHRTERVIAAGRLLLALFLVIAVEAEPLAPEAYAAPLRQLAWLYLAYAGVIEAVVFFARSVPRHLPVATQIADLVLFSVFMHLSRGAASPFFIYFVFATVCGALRWHGRGALITGAAGLAAYAAVTLASHTFLPPPDQFEQTRFITRCTQLAVVTLMLAYLGAYQLRLQTEIASLAAWPRRLPAEEDAAVKDVLAQAAVILRVPRVVLIWQEAQEPGLRVAVQDGKSFELTREPPDAFGSLVSTELDRSSFFTDDCRAGNAFVVHRVPGGVASMRGRPLSAAVCEQFGMTRALALRLSTEAIEGRLFALDRHDFSVDDLLLGDVVARLVAGALEQQALILQLRDSAITDERLRLARELHDGVLQALTAVALQASRLRPLIAHDPVEAQRRLAVLEETILVEQRGLRHLLEDLHPGRAAFPAGVDVAERVNETVGRLRRQWEVDVHCDVARDLPQVDGRLAHELCRMTDEAVVNAIRHGGAQAVRVQLEPAGTETLRLRVGYQGRGFPGLRGRHDLAALNRLGAGPRTLKERVATLAGELVIQSEENSATVEITVRRARQTRAR